MKAKILKFIELSKWFNRSSQHYVLGGRTIYVNKTSKEYTRYVFNYPKAYCKFMWLSRMEILTA